MASLRRVATFLGQLESTPVSLFMMLLIHVAFNFISPFHTLVGFLMIEDVRIKELFERLMDLILYFFVNALGNGIYEFNGPIEFVNRVYGVEF